VMADMFDGGSLFLTSFIVLRSFFDSHYLIVLMGSSLKWACLHLTGEDVREKRFEKTKNEYLDQDLDFSVFVLHFQEEQHIPPRLVSFDTSTVLRVSSPQVKGNEV